MRYKTLIIENFKSIDRIVVEDIEMVLILVGKNNAGKSAIIDAVKILSKQYNIREYDFNVRNHKIIIPQCGNIDHGRTIRSADTAGSCGAV